MWVEHLSLAHFRNYDAAEISFTRGPNLLLGRNGQGKTNVVEAIAFFASLTSHRVAQDSALIQHNAESAVARLRIQREGRPVLLELQIRRDGPNRAQLNRASVKPRDLLGYFSAVMFSPEDIQIVRGDPAARRNFIDAVIIALNPVHTALFADYDRVIKQRTTLLKSLRAVRPSPDARETGAASTLQIWDERLTELGVRIMNERLRAIQLLAPPFARAYGTLVDGDHHPSISMASQVSLGSGDVPRETDELTDAFVRALAERSREERERGVTLIGPHRDDVQLHLNSLPVKGYASHGESWSFVLALRLATAELLRERSTAGAPVVILDDVFAELDQRRRERLFHVLQQYEQVIVTAAVDADVPRDVPWNTIHIEQGRILS